MDEKDYELLLELYETKNITKTAQKLFITQPARSKRIQRMEEEQQCQLFLRSNKAAICSSCLRKTGSPSPSCADSMPGRKRPC